MFKFIVNSEVINNLLKRLLPLVGSDKNSIITLCYEDDCLEVYYNTGIAKTSSRSVFYEKLPVLGGAGKGKISIDTAQLLNLKIPSFVSETKYPWSKEVTFEVTPASINVVYDTYWSSNKVSKSNFRLAVLDALDDLESYKSLFSTYVKYIEVHTDDFLRGITFSSSMKGDANAKESNGCLLKCSKDYLLLVATDSNTAVKYCCEILEVNTLDFSVVVAPSVLNFIRNFLINGSSFKIAAHKNSVYVETENRKMLVPILGKDYIIEDVDEFFTVSGQRIANLELKALVSAMQVVVKKASDIYRRLVLTFKSNQFILRSEEDYVEGLPAHILNDGSFSVNGDFLLGCCNKLSQLDADALLYYLEESQRITIASADEKVVFLIQGMSID